jgi:flagellar basal-body rod modification protein FlgD
MNPVSNTVSTDLLTTMNGGPKAAGAAGAAGAATAAASGGPNANGLTSNTAKDTENRFLKLLTTQLKNQDPNNPMDNAALTSQIAQLSTVTGIEKLNSSVGGMVSNMQSGQTIQAASMIGHNVLAPGNNATLMADASPGAKGSKAVFGIQLPSAADSVKVTIRDANGVAVHAMDLGKQPAGTVPIMWDGATDTGATAPNGAYTFDVAATADGANVAATKLGQGTVSSITNGASGVKLNVSNLGSIGMSDVAQIL